MPPKHGDEKTLPELLRSEERQRLTKLNAHKTTVNRILIEWLESFDLCRIVSEYGRYAFVAYEIPNLIEYRPVPFVYINAIPPEEALQKHCPESRIAHHIVGNQYFISTRDRQYRWTAGDTQPSLIVVRGSLGYLGGQTHWPSSCGRYLLIPHRDSKSVIVDFDTQPPTVRTVYHAVNVGMPADVLYDIPTRCFGFTISTRDPPRRGTWYPDTSAYVLWVSAESATHVRITNGPVDGGSPPRCSRSSQFVTPTGIEVSLFSGMFAGVVVSDNLSERQRVLSTRTMTHPDAGFYHPHIRPLGPDGFVVELAVGVFRSYRFRVVFLNRYKPPTQLR